MGDVTTGQIDNRPVIAITGASGFLGRACVAEARRRGLPVVALYRSAPAAGWADDGGITPVRMDLSAKDSVAELVQILPEGCSIIHAAAHLGDDPARLITDTLHGTANLLATRRGRQMRLVLISSLAVYDTDRLQPGDAMTESSALIDLPDTASADPLAILHGARDPYAGAKRAQELRLLEDADAWDCWILRPGAIWGPGRSWHALQGFWASKLFVTIGSDGELPLAHVDQVARAAVEAARTQTTGTSVLNVFDDDRPTRARFLRAHRRCHGWPRLNLTIPYGAWLALARLLRPVSDRLPGLFREPILRARLMPLTFPTNRLRSAFGGEDIDTFEAMMARTCEGDR